MPVYIPLCGKLLFRAQCAVYRVCFVQQKAAALKMLLRIDGKCYLHVSCRRVSFVD